jgi:nucleoside-diphosphate-sugar epimerase
MTKVYSAPIILITGGNGFLGSHICDTLSSYDLRLLLRPASALDYIQNVRYQRASGDVRDQAAVEAAVQGVDIVVHAAGLSMGRPKPEMQAVNLEGTARVAKAARAAGVRRFIYVSSIAARQPVNAYGRSKAAGERAALTESAGMEVIIVRPPIMYGPRDKALLPFYKLMKLNIALTFNRRVSIVQVKDAAKAIACIVQGAERESGRIYTLNDGEAYSGRELSQHIAAAMGKKPWTISVPSWLTRLPDWTCDSEALHRHYGWEPRYDARTGFAETVRWYRSEGWL